jgi:hypothetical protein
MHEIVAEGATAQEPLRQKGRRGTKNLESDGVGQPNSIHRRGSRPTWPVISQVNGQMGAPRRRDAPYFFVFGRACGD